MVAVASSSSVIELCVCAQPMRDDATMKRRPSLAGRIQKMIPA